MNIMTREQYQELNKEVLEVKKQIECYLQRQTKEAYMKICEILNSDYCGKLLGQDRELFVLANMANIQQQEMIRGEKNCVFDKRGIKQIFDLYQDLVFYLRRLEFDLPIELQKEIVLYMSEQHLSAICIWGVIQMAPYIYNKEKTLNNFMNLLEAM